MELWIRSQDKKRLLPINDELYIPNSRTGEDFGIFYRETMLGHYKNEERALEVLDEIVDLMLPAKEHFDENGEYSCKGCFTNKDMMYYEMPKE